MAAVEPEWGGLPIVTNSPDQTKNQVILHVSSPTKPYQDPCPRCETPGAFGLVQEPLPIVTE